MRAYKYDPAIFMFNEGNISEVIVCIHVDNICWGGTEQFEGCVISKLKINFLFGATDSGTFK